MLQADKLHVPHSHRSRPGRIFLRSWTSCHSLSSRITHHHVCPCVLLSPHHCSDGFQLTRNLDQCLSPCNTIHRLSAFRHAVQFVITGDSCAKSTQNSPPRRVTQDQAGWGSSGSAGFQTAWPAWVPCERSLCDTVECTAGQMHERPSLPSPRDQVDSEKVVAVHCAHLFWI